MPVGRANELLVALDKIKAGLPSIVSFDKSIGQTIANVDRLVTSLQRFEGGGKLDLMALSAEKDQQEIAELGKEIESLNKRSSGTEGLTGGGFTSQEFNNIASSFGRVLPAAQSLTTEFKGGQAAVNNMAEGLKKMGFELRQQQVELYGRCSRKDCTERRGHDGSA